MALVIDLDAAEARDPGQVGGKGTALATLARHGLPVPPTLCLTTAAYEAFVDAASLRPVIRQELGRKDFADMRWEEIWDTALRIRNRFLRAAIPDRVRTELGERLTGGFLGAPLAVRSSALGEDAEGVSFAGLHDSIVGVWGLEQVLEAVRSVWASLWTDRALLYRRELGIDPDSSTMAVVIQRLVEGQISGIAFGSHPVRPEQLAVEAVHGLNQGLVDGTIEPDHWAVDSATGRIVEHRAPECRRRLVLGDRGTLVEAPPDLPPPLDEERLIEVIDAVRAAGDVFGCPQDVEWTIAGDLLILLQSRPVTTGTSGKDDRRAWYLSLTRSLENLRRLRRQVEGELLPAMNREADEIADRHLGELDNHDLAEEIEDRRATHDRWVDVYWRDFIPFAHGIRLFGQFYNEIVRPDDPHEFMRLLGGTPMLSLRRNRRLAELAELVRHDAALRSALPDGSMADDAFNAAFESFLDDFGTAVYANQACFADRHALIRLLLVMASSPPAPAAFQAGDVAAMTGAFLASVPVERRPLAEELLDMGRSSYQIRDDDNIHLARHKALVLDAVEEGRRRLRSASPVDARIADPDQVAAALRHPNLVVEPPRQPNPLATEGGLRPQPRQLVGQPAGPGLATGPARIVTDVQELFEIQPGEVLVCDAVEPNMTFVVPMVCAVIERRGGMLIHGAIIAREYGLPCVTGVPDATTRIGTGDRLTVDGHLGIVTISPSR
jgi:phosphohistidine swiveling domain-containing protein